MQAKDTVKYWLLRYKCSAWDLGAGKVMSFSSTMVTSAPLQLTLFVILSEAFGLFF